MEYKSVLKIFVIAIFIIGTLNFAYADSGPEIGPNQAKITAQYYLITHNLHYIASTPRDVDWKAKVNDTKTGEVKWIPFDEIKLSDHYGKNRYYPVGDFIDAWVVQVKDINGNNVGSIYIDAENNQILNDTNINNNILLELNKQTGFSDSTWIIAGAFLIILIAGVGYWLYSRR